MNTKWHKGPPPSVGWWPASDSRVDGFYRWWDGRMWSRRAHEYMNLTEVATAASIRQYFNHDEIEWTHRPASWPARSRT